MMTLDKKKISSKKKTTDDPVDGRIKEMLTVRNRDGVLSCAEAFDIAKNLDVSTVEVGRAMDQMEIKIDKCQLGLFGHKGGKRVIPDNFPPDTLLEMLSPFRETRRMPCSRAYEIAKELKISRPAVANACEALGIRIAPCQLGAF